MKIELDKEADATYISIAGEIKEGEVEKTIEVNDSIILDFDKEGKLVGIEVLNASKNLNSEFLKSLVKQES